MSIGSEVRNERPLTSTSGARRIRFSGPTIPYILAVADGIAILMSSLVGGVGYNFLAGNFFPEVTPYFAVGVLAAIIYFLQMNRKGYYAFPDCAKPGVEINDILVCWFMTGLLLALFAFLFKVGVDYSRGSFLTFCFVAPTGLLTLRKTAKLALTEAVARGAIGRRDAVLVGDFDEISSLGPQDLLAFFGAAEINRFLLSQDAGHSERCAMDSHVIRSVASFVRLNSCQEILLALPWEDTDRIEFVRDQI